MEKNAQARAFAKEHFGLDVKPDTALQDFAPGSFDVITLWHVMEHLEHLNETWDTLNSLLTEKGVLIIAVPNCSSYDAKKYGAHWAAYDVPRHLWHFTPGTIQRLGAKHEFILAARHPMPFDAFYVSMLSEKYMGHSMSFFRGILSGTLAWFSALASKERSSSMIYVSYKWAFPFSAHRKVSTDPVYVECQCMQWGRRTIRWLFAGYVHCRLSTMCPMGPGEVHVFLCWYGYGRLFAPGCGLR